MGTIYNSNPAKEVRLRIKKETGNEFNGKNILGLQTVNRIAKGVVIGYFVKESISKTKFQSQKDQTVHSINV